MSNPRKLASAAKIKAPIFENASPEFPRKSSGASLKSAKQSTIHDVTNFLEQNEARAPRQCGNCGGPLQSMDAYFWLDGTDVASLVPLTFCPACEPDVLTALRRKTRHQQHPDA
jgi:hypothetical protein